MSSGTLVADEGSVALTGNDATVAQTVVIGDIGSYALTGQAANLGYGRTLAAGVRSYALTGQAAVFARTRSVAASVRSFSIAGQATGLLSGHVLVGNVAPTFALSGQDIDPRQTGYLLATAAGSYNLTGFIAAFSIAGALEVVASGQTYAIAGQDTGIVKGSILSADAGSFAASFVDAGFSQGLLLSAEPGILEVTGYSAALEADNVLHAAFKAFGLTMRPVSFSLHRRRRKTSPRSGHGPDRGMGRDGLQDASIVRNSAQSLKVRR